MFAQNRAKYFWMLRDRVLGIPVGNVVLGDKLHKLVARTQLRSFKVNEFVNKY